MSCIIGTVISSFAGIAFMIGFFLGLVYAQSYYDGTEKNGRRAWPQLKKMVARLSYPIQKHYFGFNVVYKGSEGLCDLVKHYHSTDSAIFAGSPHGLVAISSLFLVGLPTEEDHDTNWHRVTPCIHRHVFTIPFLRDVALWLGAIDVSRNNIVEKLKTNSVYLAPGGCREMIMKKNDVSQIQNHHKGFLRIAYSEKKLVFPIIHKGQEHVFREYPLFSFFDRMRVIVLDMTGYPFPSFFVGPFPGQLTTYVFDPHDPSQYTDEQTFINDYYKNLYAYENALK